MHPPLRHQTRKEIKISAKPWLSKGILKSIRNKNTMFKKCYKHNDAALTEKCKKFANKLTTIKRVAKQNYYAAMTELNKNIYQNNGN